MEQNRTEQLTLNLNPEDPYSAQFLVLHSGIVQAYHGLTSAVERLELDASYYTSAYVHGPQGSGKRHLLHVVNRLAQEQKVGGKFVQFHLDSTVIPERVPEMVSAYEYTRSNGGVVVFVSECAPKDQSEDPHLRSRFLAGSVFELSSPQEDEFYSVVCSLMERRNLKLSRPAFSYLLSRLPRNITSFARILDEIDRFCLDTGRPARRFSAIKVLEIERKK